MNTYLIIAGGLSFIASVLHIGIILGGPSWYRFFGAGEAMAVMAENRKIYPALVTLGIASILAIWGVYAWSGAGLITELPLTKWALIAISAVYLIRGTVGVILPFVSQHPQIQENSIKFWIVSSLICLTFAAFHILGTFILINGKA